MNSEQILKAVQRSLWIEAGKVLTFVLVLISGLVLLSGKTHYLLVGGGFVVVVVFQLIVGRYLPIRNRHESLLSQFGEAYLAEATVAVDKFGMRELLRGRWFETFAAEFCRRRIKVKDQP